MVYLNTQLNILVFCLSHILTFLKWRTLLAVRGHLIATGAHEVMIKNELQLHFAGGGIGGGP